MYPNLHNSKLQYFFLNRSTDTLPYITACHIGGTQIACGWCMAMGGGRMACPGARTCRRGLCEAADVRRASRQPVWGMIGRPAGGGASMVHRWYTNCVRVVQGPGRGSDGLSGGSDMPARSARGRRRAPCIAAAGVGHDWQACRRWCIDGASMVHKLRAGGAWPWAGVGWLVRGLGHAGAVCARPQTCAVHRGSRRFRSHVDMRNRNLAGCAAVGVNKT